MNRLVLSVMVLFSFTALADNDLKTQQILNDVSCLNGSKHIKSMVISNVYSPRLGLYAGKTVNNDVIILDRKLDDEVAISTYICPENVSSSNLQGTFFGEFDVSLSDKCSVGAVQAARLILQDSEVRSTNFFNFFPIHMQTPKNLKLSKVCDEFALTIEQFKAIFDDATEDEKSSSSNPAWADDYRAAVTLE